MSPEANPMTTQAPHHSQAFLSDDPNADSSPFTPETLDVLALHTENLRCRALFGIEDKGTSDPAAEQYYLLGLVQLEAAVRHFKLAMINQRRYLRDHP